MSVATISMNEMDAKVFLRKRLSAEILKYEVWALNVAE